MFFELNGKTYKVKFSRSDSMTFAELFVLEESGSLFNTGIDGVSICSPKDKFDKNKGRKVALADLLSKMCITFLAIAGYNISKEDRTKIWEEYFLTHRK